MYTKNKNKNKFFKESIEKWQESIADLGYVYGYLSNCKLGNSDGVKFSQVRLRTYVVYMAQLDNVIRREM